MRDGHEQEPALTLAEGLVNSHLPSGEHVSLDSPRAVATFLEAYGVPVDRPPSGRDVRDLAELSDRLRRVFEAPDDHRAAAVLNGLLAGAGARPWLAGDDRLGWHIDHVPAGASLAQRLAVRTAMALAMVLTEEGSDRLRVCAWETCRDVFVDRSRNRSRRFCSPRVCGNRAAVAAWRARQRSTKTAR